MSTVIAHDFFRGFIKLHILHHAAHEPIYGVWLIEELGRHGYRLSPGTLYPILHALEKDKLLRSQDKIEGGKVRKYYAITARGRRSLKEAKHKIRELVDEIYG